ncbi:hypothetical protein M5D96_012325, partial [Drosophila gunungcola]
TSSGRFNKSASALHSDAGEHGAKISCLEFTPVSSLVSILLKPLPNC